jgi:PadR family transcriptional regulator PadR
MPRHRRGWGMGNGRNIENRHSPLTNTLLEPVLLILLKEKPRHGYTILSDLGTMGIDTLHPSVVYRILRDLEGLEWIQSDWDIDETQGPPRRVYRLTPLGEDALGNWLNELKKTQDLISSLLTRIEK